MGGSVDRRVGSVRRVSSARCFVNARVKVRCTGLRGGALRLVRYSGLRGIGTRVLSLRFSAGVHGLFVKAFRQKILVCSVSAGSIARPPRDLGSVDVAQVGPLGTGRLLVTSSNNNMRGVGIRACRVRPCVVTSCGDGGNVGNGDVGSLCVSRRRQV